MTDRTKLLALMERGCAFLGCDLAILGGAMSWLSESNLVSAISNSGCFGVIACGAMSPDMLNEMILETQSKTIKPFGVNLITMHPDLDDLVEVCIRNRVGHIFLAGGLPPMGAVSAIKAGGAKVICFTPTLAFAKRLVRSGVDALVIEGVEAGGHIGAVATSVLVQEIIPHISEVPIFVAGGIGRGEMIAAYLQQGASGAQLGTRFVCAKESIAHPDFKKAFIQASARDAISSVQIDPRFPVIPVRALKNKGSERFAEVQRQIIDRVDKGEMDLATGRLEVEQYWAGALRRAVIDGDVVNGSLMAGQSVGMVKQEEPLLEIIDSLVKEACDYLN